MTGQRAAVGSLMLIGARLVTRVFDLATMLVLARLLLPSDFGLVAIASTLVTIVEAASEIPVAQALVRLPTITAAQYHTAFTLSALRAGLIIVVLVIAAWPFALFYGDLRLVPLVCVLGIAPASRGLVSPRLAEFQKRMNFSRDIAIEIVGKIIGFGAGVGIALLTDSYWSIIVSSVIYPLSMTLISYYFAPYQPNFSLAELDLFAGFIGWMSAAQIVSALNWQFERLLLGKLETASRLGLFSTSNDLATIPMTSLFGPVLRPLLAGFSPLLHDRDRLRRAYQTASSAVLLLGLPLMAAESVLAEPIVLLLLGERWRGAIPLLRLLSLSLMPGLLALPTVPLIMAFGRTKLLFSRNFVEFCVKLPLVLLGTVQFGITGIIWARIISETITAVYCARLVKQLIGLAMFDQLSKCWRPLLSTLIMVVSLVFALQAIPSQHSPLGLGLLIATLSGVGGLTYFGALAALWIVAGRPAGPEAIAVSLLRRRTRTA